MFGEEIKYGCSLVATLWKKKALREQTLLKPFFYLSKRAVGYSKVNCTQLQPVQSTVLPYTTF